MPQPISRQLAEFYRGHPKMKIHRHKLLGYFFEYTGDIGGVKDPRPFAYRAANNGTIFWVTERTMKRRMKTGHARTTKPQPLKQRKKPILPDSTFSLDELEQAAAIIKDLP